VEIVYDAYRGENLSMTCRKAIMDVAPQNRNQICNLKNTREGNHPHKAIQFDHTCNENKRTLITLNLKTYNKNAAIKCTEFI
jgi:hypothetical protein